MNTENVSFIFHDYKSINYINYSLNKQVKEKQAELNNLEAQCIEYNKIINAQQRIIEEQQNRIKSLNELNRILN